MRNRSDTASRSRSAPLARIPTSDASTLALSAMSTEIITFATQLIAMVVLERPVVPLTLFEQEVSEAASESHSE